MSAPVLLLQAHPPISNVSWSVHTAGVTLTTGISELNTPPTHTHTELLPMLLSFCLWSHRCIQEYPDALFKATWAYCRSSCRKGCLVSLWWSSQAPVLNAGGVLVGGAYLENWPLVKHCDDRTHRGPSSHTASYPPRRAELSSRLSPFSSA